MAALAQTSQAFLDGMAIAELVLHPPLVALASLNFIVVFGTGCLHPNLRFILLTQSANIGLFELLRWLLTVQKTFAFGATNVGSVEIRTLSLVTGMFRNSVGHVLFLERLMATLFVRKYEHFGQFTFSAGWFSILFTYCALNGYAYWQSAATTIFVLSSNFVAVCICIAEILVLIVIATHNLRKYAKLVPNIHTYSLSEKYQFAENIRTSRQLAIVFLCHFLNNLMFAMMNSLIFYKSLLPGNWNSVLFTFLTNLNSIVDIAIEVTVITHHPMLAKRTKEILRKFCFCKSQRRHSFRTRANNNITRASNSNTVVPVNNGVPRGRDTPKNVLGTSLLNPISREQYLQMIEAGWR